MSNLIEIQVQIEKLQKQAEDIKSKEFDRTVQDIVTKMRAFGITIKDLQAASSRGTRSKSKSKAPRAARPASKAKGVPVAAKYRGPNGETWSGRGLMPRWMASLVAEGRTKEEFVIQQ